MLGTTTTDLIGMLQKLGIDECWRQSGSRRHHKMLTLTVDWRSAKHGHPSYTSNRTHPFPRFFNLQILSPLHYQYVTTNSFLLSTLFNPLYRAFAIADEGPRNRNVQDVDENLVTHSTYWTYKACTEAITQRCKRLRERNKKKWTKWSEQQQ